MHTFMHLEYSFVLVVLWKTPLDIHTLLISKQPPRKP